MHPDPAHKLQTCGPHKILSEITTKIWSDRRKVHLKTLKYDYLIHQKGGRQQDSKKKWNIKNETNKLKQVRQSWQLHLTFRSKSSVKSMRGSLSSISSVLSSSSSSPAFPDCRVPWPSPCAREGGYEGGPKESPPFSHPSDCKEWCCGEFEKASEDAPREEVDEGCRRLYIKPHTNIFMSASY